MTSALLNSAAYFLDHPIARRQRLRTVARIVHWQVVSRLQKTVTWPWIEGTTLSVQNGMKGATGSFYFGLHEFSAMALVAHLLRPGELFVDGGANVGIYTLLASAIVGARTVAFEPDPAACAAAAENVRRNGISHLVDLHRVALGERTGTIGFTQGFDTMNRICEDAPFLVSVEPLDSFGLSPVVIKLDLEGAERPALRGSYHTLRRPTLLAVINEDPLPGTARLLEDAGFEHVTYNPFIRRLGPKDGFKSGCALYVRRDAATEARLLDARSLSIFGESV